jgi:hypothetical protein
MLALRFDELSDTTTTRQFSDVTTDPHPTFRRLLPEPDRRRPAFM